MTIYNVMQCSICRRIKDIPKDDKRAVPNQCIITKGCNGFLFITGETTVLTQTTPVSGLTDWYARGTTQTVTAAAESEQTVDVSTTSSGGLTLALNVPVSSVSTSNNPWGSSPPTNVVATFYQQLTQDVPYTEYVYNLGSATSVISGKDSNGKNLRFSVSDVTAGLVFVLVNGVASFASSTATSTGWWTTVANKITFYNQLAAGSVVTVAVYTTSPISKVSLNFILNQNLTNPANYGSWGNVRWAEEYDPTTGAIKANKWWLYTCSSAAPLGNSARLKFIGIFTNASNLQVLPLTSAPSNYSGIRFLMASPPYDNADRYLNFYVDAETVASAYALVTSTADVTELYADSSALTELYPPLQLIETADLSTSFISADTFPTDDSASETQSRLTGSKILGPQ